jgi:8-oxo-dGTP pyrophosphatase MutT (NUDIX family)
MPSLKSALSAYIPSDPDEQVFKTAMLALLADEPRAFWRDVFQPGHFTGSALVTNPGRTRVLLIRHGTLQRWMQFGGHADGEGDLAKVALREVTEESGFPPSAFTLQPGILDLDIHPIPANPSKAEPAHSHFDVRYLLELDDTLPLPPNPEGLTLRWLRLDEAAVLTGGERGVVRMLEKLDEP